MDKIAKQIFLFVWLLFSSYTYVFIQISTKKVIKKYQTKILYLLFSRKLEGQLLSFFDCVMNKCSEDQCYIILVTVDSLKA